MFFTPIFIVFTLFLLANTQTTTKYITTTHITTKYKTTTHTATSRSKPIPVLPTSMDVTPKAIQEYLSSVTTQPEFISAAAAFQSAIPDDIYSEYVEFHMNPFGPWPTAGYLSWMDAVPLSDVLYIATFLDEEDAIKTSLMLRTAAGSAPTNRPRVEVVGAALAVGAAGLAML